MTAYESGFADGERQAFKDRRNHVRRSRPEAQVQSTYLDGWWDGYTPRSLTWLLHKDPQPYWADRESEIA